MKHDPFEPGLLTRLPHRPRKVAVLRASRLGDFICATPAFRALRAALPEAEITIITLPILRDLAVRLSSFDRYVAFPGYPGLAEQFFEARRALDFFQEMQAQHFDLALQMQGSGVYSNPFTLMLGAQVTAGFVHQPDWPSRLDGALRLPETGHEVQRVLALPLFLGLPAQGVYTEFPLQARDHAAAAGLLQDAQEPLIGLHPGAREEDRRWSPRRLGAAGAELRRRFGGTLVVMGMEAERALARTVIESAGPPCIDLVGQTPLAVLGAVMARLAVFVGNDSGPAHVAYAVGTPTVTVFGCFSPERYGPPAGGAHVLVRGEDRQERPDVDETLPCTGSRDLANISVQQVVAAAERVIFDRARPVAAMAG